MTRSPKDLTRRCSADHQFLVCRADKASMDVEERDAHPSGSGSLSDAFPGMLIGTDFIETVKARTEKMPDFDVMAVRIDGESQRSETTDDFIVSVAQSIEQVCETEDGIWGSVQEDVFGCVFPVSDGRDVTERADLIQQHIKERSKRTVTIGIARYPTIDFTKDDILANALKALDHAAFFGPSSVVCFDAVSLNISGDQYYQKDDMEGAVEEFLKALSMDPNNVNVRNSLGVCYAVLGEMDKAIDEFEAARRIDPSEVMAVYNRGLICLLDDEDDEKALEYFLEADGLDENVFEVSLQIGRLYLQRENTEEAMNHLQKAVDVNPESGVSWRYLADCWFAMGKKENAKDAYQKAVKLNPNDAEALSALGFLLLSMGENEEISMTFCEHSVEISPDNGLFRYRLANIYLKQERLKVALEEFQRAAALGFDASSEIEQIRELIGNATLEKEHGVDTDAP